jgi:tetratricopeptide (TPR) repeat protein
LGSGGRNPASLSPFKGSCYRRHPLLAARRFGALREKRARVIGATLLTAPHRISAKPTLPPITKTSPHLLVTFLAKTPLPPPLSLALSARTQAIALDPSNHVYYSNRSICRAESGHLGEAKADGEKCVALEPAFVKGYHRKANAEFLLGELEAAEATIRAGLKRDPTMAELKRLLQKVQPRAAHADSLIPNRHSRAPASNLGVCVCVCVCVR